MSVWVALNGPLDSQEFGARGFAIQILDHAVRDTDVAELAEGIALY